MTDLYPQNPADSHAIIAEWSEQPVANMADMRRQLERQAAEIADLKAEVARQKAKRWKAESGYARLWESLHALLTNPPGPVGEGEAG